MEQMNEQAFFIEMGAELAAQAISYFRRGGNDAVANQMDAALNAHARETYQRIIARANAPTAPIAPPAPAPGD